jgi:hypothetical protein
MGRIDDERRKTMIAERRTYNVRLEDQAIVDLIKAEMQAVGPEVVSRVYRSEISSLGVVIHEMEFEDLAEREAFWAKWREKRATPEFWAKWREIVAQGGNVEIWRLE